jgi:hypothetical protein
LSKFCTTSIFSFAGSWGTAETKARVHLSATGRIDRDRNIKEKEKLLFGSHTLTKHRGVDRLNGIISSPVKHMASSVFGALFVALLGDEDGDGEHKLPPGSPPTCMSTVLRSPFFVYSQLHNSEV